MLVPIILSGGAGTRLWPVSRETHPKPFMKLKDGMSLLQKTLQRVSQLKDVNQILTVTNQAYYFKTQEEYQTTNLPAHIQLKFMLEPVGRNTGPAICMAAWYIKDILGPDAVLFILPADHLIENDIEFNHAVENAYALASNNKLVTFGIEPSIPHTGYGYIQYDKASDAVSNGFSVKQFVEKPDRSTAEHYIRSGNYLWNSGMFCFQAETILQNFKTHSPAIYELTERCWAHSKLIQSQDNLIRIDKDIFHEAISLSIDYAVLEKAEQVMVLPCQFGWNDIGSWNAVSDLIDPDESGNRALGDTLLIDVNNSFIQSENRLVAAVGVQDLVVVDTPDALLITNNNRTQDVKEIVNQLKLNDHDSYKIHKTVFRPWGSFTVLEESQYFKIKRIVVKPGAALSLQMHYHRSEHWVVVKGMAKVTRGEVNFLLNNNESTFIPAGHNHRLENPGLIDLILIEVQTGDYLGEDDIIRLEDKYARAEIFS